MGRLALIALAAVGLVVAGSGCKKRPKPDATAAAPAAASVPIDRTAPGEIAEGNEDAFGLKLPRPMHVTARFASETFAEGQLPLELVANYVRQHVTARHVDTGPAKTVFTGAAPNAAPGKTLRVEVFARAGTTQLLVRDETRPAPDERMSPEDRMRAVGLKPDGTPLDPTHLQ